VHTPNSETIYLLSPNGLSLQNQITNSKEACYIDIWPINFFAPDSITKIDNCWLFLMQLACILHMVPGWKKATTVRVFMCVDNKVRDASLLHRQWEQMLAMLRIEATIHVVIWDHITSPLDQSLTDFRHANVTYNPMNNTLSDNEVTENSINEQTDDEPPVEPFQPDENYLRNVNTMIQEHSSSTAVVFLYLPPPPTVAKDKPLFLSNLDMLTANLPPTLLVHGISPVTSTTL